MSELSFPVDIRSGLPVVGAPDEVDVANAGELRAALLEAAAHGTGTLVVDLSRTEFCDSAGLNVIVRAHQRAQHEGGELRLVAGGAHVVRLLTVTGLDQVIPSYATLAEALAATPASRAS
jgi:anti-sigma B factor antagonist